MYLFLFLTDSLPEKHRTGIKTYMLKAVVGKLAQLGDGTHTLNTNLVAWAKRG